MKRNFLAIVLVAAGLMMSACNNGSNQNQNGNNNSNKKENVVTPKNDDPSGIRSIEKVWAAKAIDVDPGDKTPGIEQFALAFCKEYPGFPLNEVLRNYITYDSYEHSGYEIVNDPSQGYIHCMWEVQTTPVTDVCYWNRNNGNKLVAIYMEDTHESGEWYDRLVAFYDFDPATNMMTPEPALTEMIVNRVKKYDTYAVTLPREGKDIEVVGYIFDEEEDTSDSKEMLLKWNGMTFDWTE